MQFLQSWTQERNLHYQTVSKNMLWGWTFKAFKTSANRMASKVLKTIQRAMNSDWPDHRHNTKKPVCTFFKFWTQFVEKIVNLCGFK